MPKFIHIRRYAPDSKDPSPTGGFTIAYELRDNSINYYVAQCAHHDHYNRRIGRSVALGRLLKGETIVTIPHDENRSLADQVIADWSGEND